MFFNLEKRFAIPLDGRLAAGSLPRGCIRPVPGRERDSDTLFRAPSPVPTPVRAPCPYLGNLQCARNDQRIRATEKQSNYRIVVRR